MDISDMLIVIQDCIKEIY